MRQDTLGYPKEYASYMNASYKPDEINHYHSLIHSQLPWIGHEDEIVKQKIEKTSEDFKQWS
jgi:hypothetical protein